MTGVALPGLALPGVALAGLALPGVTSPGLALPKMTLPCLRLPGMARLGWAWLETGCSISEFHSGSTLQLDHLTVIRCNLFWSFQWPWSHHH